MQSSNSNVTALLENSKATNITAILEIGTLSVFGLCLVYLCFQIVKHSNKNDCLVVAGSNPDYQIKNDRIFYVGNLSQDVLFSLYKRSKYFIHLAFLDHCPNVVVDARAAGCKIICASSGGTKEIAGSDALIVKDIDWDFKPLKLYEPPDLDLSSFIDNGYYTNIDIENVAARYADVLTSITSR